MSIKYKFDEYIVAYGHDYLIESPVYIETSVYIETPVYTDSNAKFSLDKYIDIFNINKDDGSIYIGSKIDIGVYYVTVITQNDQTILKIIIKPNITYKITSFYNNGKYNNFLPITNPQKLIGEYKFEENYENINIDNETGEISFTDDIIAGTYNLVINSKIKNIEQTCITTFNIYPIIKYEKENYLCEKISYFKSDIPYIKPDGGTFKFNNDYTGINIDNITGQISINKPKSGSYNLIVVYKYNNTSINTNILLNIKPDIIYEKVSVDYNNLIQLSEPKNSDLGGVYKLEKNSLNQNLSINTSNGKITIKNPIISGLYFVKVFYTYNNYTSEVISEICIIPNIGYVNNKIEIIFGSKYQTEKPYSNEEITGTFCLTKYYENIHINPKNGIIYINEFLDCNDYCIDINYNKNDVNKIIQFYIKVKPYINIKNNKKQEINYYEKLNNIIIETNPNGGIITNNLDLSIENNFVNLCDFSKKIDNYELKINYIYNNIPNYVVYDFCILPYIIYNTNNVNILFKQNYTSDPPTIFPFDGIFSIETKINNVFIDEKTGIINIKSGLNIGNYELIINYRYNNIKNTTTYNIKVKPLFNIENCEFIYEYNPFSNVENHNLEPLDVYPKGGIYTSDIFTINKNGVISIPSNLEIDDYKINIKYSYLDMDTEFTCYLKVIPYKLNCLFKQYEKIYDGTTDILLKYVINNNIKLNLKYESNFDNKNVGFGKQIYIKNIEVLNNRNIIHDDITIIGVIKSRKLNIDFKGIEKIYNGLNDAQVKYTIENIIDNDEVFIESYNCYFENINVGKQKIIINKIVLGGIDSKNYYTEIIYETLGIIKPKEVYVSFLSPTVINGESTRINLTIDNIEGLIENEKIFINSYDAYFETSDIGENIPIIVRNIVPFKNNNYILLSKPLFGNIIKKEITLNANSINKYYDGTNIAQISFNDLNIKIINYNAHYENKNVGNKKKIYVTNIISDNDNYILKDFIIYGSILPLELSVRFFGENKIYDETDTIKGKYEFINKVEDDEIEIKTKISFKNSNVENNKDIIYSIPRLIGKDSSNYKINKLILNKPHIFKKKIDIDFIGIDKTYDNTTTAYVKLKSIDKNIKIKSYNALFENKDAGENKKIIISDIQIINDNYYCETTYAYANIGKKLLTLVVEPQNKEYDGTNSANIKIINIVGICFNDNIYISNYIAEYKDIYVGVNKIINISNIEYGGISKDNYYCKDFTILSSITKKKLLFDVLNNEKFFDGNTKINIILKPINIIENDIVNIKSFLANFNNIDVGDNKDIYVKNILLEGSEYVNNYLVNDFICQGNILPSNIDLKFMAKDKIFDYTNKAIINLIGNYNITYESEYEDFNVGNNKKIIVKIISGHIPNYILNNTYYTYGSILPIEITIIPIIKNKIYDNTTNHIITFDLSNNQVIDYCAEFDNPNVGTNKKLFIKNIKLKNQNYYCKDFRVLGTIIPTNINLDIIVNKKIFDNTTKATISKTHNIVSYDAEFVSPNVGIHDVNIKNIITNNKNIIINDCVIKSEILPKIIPINIIINEKEYDGNNKATIKKYDSKYDVKIINYDAEFDNEIIDKNKNIYVRNLQLDDKNYAYDNLVLISSIIKKDLNIIFKDTTKIYDGTTNTTLEILKLDGIVNNENVKINKYNSQYLNKYPGEVILFINNILLEGAHSDNYNIENMKIKTFIFKRKLKYSIRVSDKKYDGNNYAFVNIVLNNIVNDEDVYIENFIATYKDENIGNDKEITIKNIILGGEDKCNYDIEKEIILSGNII